MTVWMQITSGRGPAECCRAIYHAMHCIIKEGEKKGMTIDILETIEENYPKTLKSVLLGLKESKEKEENLQEFISLWHGTIQWIAASPFRPNHKRKNWFIAIHILEPPKDDFVYNNNDFLFETMRASGHGGQHVNKTNTAVRITHKPTGLTAIAQEERSQYMNKRLAVARLLQRLEEKQIDNQKQEQQSRWESHNSLERGNPVRVFYGEKFTPA